MNRFHSNLKNGEDSTKKFYSLYRKYFSKYKEELRVQCLEGVIIARAKETSKVQLFIEMVDLSLDVMNVFETAITHRGAVVLNSQNIIFFKVENE